ncbi:nucleotide exchange factor GrpE [Croceicoccus sp. F390]|uniref:Protein GrpE n=1 Tax=Croceicoccus esteveae TaxID=3075597 RepID=A0ABU2ZG26_9SPHN|nr:nucleotide exchange factor GrpE [Croceicoccus sp. F390]MDT0575542.1 nucleotide exchange factor GrpE [Croceicoccus sp. F390]
MSDEHSRDTAVENELKGVPDDMIEPQYKDGSSDLPDEGIDIGDDADRLGEVEAELAEAKQQVLYARAETQNVRRRMERDIADVRSYAATGFARDILSVSDNLHRGLEAIPKELRSDDRLKGLVAGIEATARELEKVFTQHGITRIAAVGLPLDPNQHQAMIEVPTDEAEPGTVVQEMQSGYMIRDRLLRPAMVGVAKKP